MSPRTSLFLPNRQVPGIDKVETEEFLIPSGDLKVGLQGTVTDHYMRCQRSKEWEN